MNADQITAIGAVVVALTGLVTAVGVVLLQLQSKKNAVDIQETKRVVKDSHVMINSQREVMVARIEQLGESLRQADVAVPIEPAKK